ncbi:hypothetical protein OS493_023821 [Desmophyllum pertusum]|uniref:Uncharacterized protein n=1 Tax=Desmophyllum pertusum TaxID=174260 RepID=A0A9W9YQ64_9CNID|nr:hypothetical protein OS493_023821 [Desmophyllum pertusum]
MTENYPNFSASRKSPLSSSSVENEVRIGEQRERKPSKVRFETEPVNIDLSETQNARESATSCTAELLKENFQPEESYSECGNISTVTVKGQKKAPVVINVKKGETKNQCPQQ